MSASPARARKILQRIFAAIADKFTELRAHMKIHAESEDIANRMRRQSEQRVALSLEFA
jgi:hypothetical protein